MSKVRSLRAYISKRSGFVTVSTIFFGSFNAVIGVLVLDELGPHRAWYVVPMAYIAGYVWGELMWLMMFKERFARLRDRSSASNDSVDDRRL